MHEPRVYLIGGPPGAGKTTLGCALAARIGGSSVTVDDLMTVAKTATTPQSHPDLYLCPPGHSIEYFTNSTFDHLRATTDRQHEAVWPFVESLIGKHFNWTTTSIVIDGWHLRPERIRAMNTDSVTACWIWIDPSVLEQRERNNMDFYNQSRDPEKMFANFMARGAWFNDFIRDEAISHGFHVLEQDGSRSVKSLCEEVLEQQGRGA